MAEYIRREDAIFPDDVYGYRDKQIINKIPSADVAEVRHGEWKWRNGGECSECGFHNSNFDYNFCPNCGADMRGGT